MRTLCSRVRHQQAHRAHLGAHLLDMRCAAGSWLAERKSPMTPAINRGANGTGCGLVKGKFTRIYNTYKPNQTVRDGEQQQLQRPPSRARLTL